VSVREVELRVTVAVSAAADPELVPFKVWALLEGDPGMGVRKVEFAGKEEA
jgi:hypothetical protein